MKEKLDLEFLYEVFQKYIPLPAEDHEAYHLAMKMLEDNKSVPAETLVIQKIAGAYEEYIKLLTEELNELTSMASVHGWKSTRVERGIELRNIIADLSQPVFACGHCEDCKHYNDEQCTNEDFQKYVGVPFVPLPVDYMTNPKFGCVLFGRKQINKLS